MPYGRALLPVAAVSRRCTLPVVVIGSAATNSISLGTVWRQLAAHMGLQFGTLILITRAVSHGRCAGRLQNQASTT